MDAVPNESEIELHVALDEAFLTPVLGDRIDTGLAELISAERACVLDQLVIANERS